jgi:hypothetical protein
METFLLAETEAGTEAEAGVGTRGIETEAVVALAIETFGTIRVFGIAEAGAGAGTGVGIALGVEAFSCARLNKNSM